MIKHIPEELNGLTEEEYNAGIRWMPGKPIGFCKVSYSTNENDCHKPSPKVAQLLEEARQKLKKAEITEPEERPHTYVEPKG
jgi:hypothetical protein